jgi:hypothetical protein
MATGTENYLSSFLSTLAQVTATLLALLAAASGAYFVFLQERLSQHEEVIEQEKLEIRDIVLKLEREWSISLGFFLPPKFEDEYRKIHPSVGLVGLTEEAATDFTFYPDHIESIYKRLESDDYFRGKHTGRTYLWIFGKVVNVLANAPSTVGPHAEKVYPEAAGGFGFDAWRKNFERMQMPMTLLESRGDAIADLNEWINELPPDRKQPILLNLAQRSINSVVTSNKEIRQKLLHLDKEQLLAKRFDPESKMHPKSLLLLGIASAIIGILVPLACLALDLQITRWAALTILIGSAVLTLGSIGHFIHHIASPPSVDWHLYLSQRWYEPMNAWLNQEKAKLRDGGEINIDFFVDAVASEDFPKFSKQMQADVKEFVDSGSLYNQATDQANQVALASLVDHFGHSAKPLQSGVSNTLCLSDLTDDKRFEQTLEAIRTSHAKLVTYEIFHQRFMTDALRIDLSSVDNAAEYLEIRLHPVRASLSGHPILIAYYKKRDRASLAFERLSTALKNESSGMR